MKKVYNFLICLVVVGMGKVYAQAPQEENLLALNTSEKDTADLLSMSLEDLMNVTIVSASRSEEKAFNAPITSYVITRAEIINSGSRNIPEALRLCPAVFVKQTAEGVFDIGIRGFDNLPTHNYMNNNKTILVMINNRPVFDYFNGGTFWQNLPVEIVDVDRIEVVYGPASALYGPNAVTGVINIITTKVEKEFVTRAIVQGGNNSTIIGQAFVGYNPNGKFSVSGSFNYHDGKRGQIDYYDRKNRMYVNSKSMLSSSLGEEGIKKIFFDEELALRKASANLNLGYKVNEKINISGGAGYNKSEALYPIIAVNTKAPFINDSYFGVLRTEIHNFSVSASVLNGNQALHGKFKPYSYDYTNTDLYADYNLKISENFSLRPAISYQNAQVNDLPYTENSVEKGLFNNKAFNSNVAASLKVDYKLNKWRFIGAIRGDKFSYPTDIYPAYQAVINYNINDKNMIRANYSRSNGGAFMAETFTNYPILDMPARGNAPALKFTLEGNKDRKLLSNTMYELGYKTIIGSNFQFDLSLFRQEATNFTYNITNDPEYNPVTNVMTIRSIYDNLALKAVQQGMTISSNIVAWDNKIHFKPFVTFQRTMWEDYSPYYSTPGYNPTVNISTTKDQEGKTTPRVFGGFYLNIMPVERLSFNLSGYTFDKFQAITLLTYNTQAGTVSDDNENYIKSKFIMNARVNYNVWKGLSIFGSARNFSHENSREYFGTDKVGNNYLFGLTFNY